MRIGLAPSRRRPAALSLVAGLVAVTAPVHAQTPAPAAAPPAPDIELKLFEKAEVDRSKGCSLALWQSNRNPDTDRYAYLFAEAIAPRTFARQPARIKVGGQVLSLQRVAAGGKTNGYGLYEYQLYKMPADGEFVVLELALGELEGEAIEVTGGTMSVIMRGKQVFRASVKGGAGCMTPAAPEPPRLPPPPPVAQAKPPLDAPAPASGVPGMFQQYPVRMAQVPKAFVQAVVKKFSCNADLITRVGITGFQMSEESAIWQVPCDNFAYQSNAVFALVYLPDPSANLTFLTVQGIKGKERPSEPGTLMDPEWDVKSRTVKSVSLGRAQGDCGVMERYRVTAEGRFELLEYRQKESCDGKATKPETYPLVYRAR